MFYQKLWSIKYFIYIIVIWFHYGGIADALAMSLLGYHFALRITKRHFYYHLEKVMLVSDLALHIIRPPLGRQLRADAASRWRSGHSSSCRWSVGKQQCLDPAMLKAGRNARFLQTLTRKACLVPHVMKSPGLCACNHQGQFENRSVSDGGKKKEVRDIEMEDSDRSQSSPS